MLKVTCAIIIENGRLLIAQNGSNSDHPFQWEFPGGKLKDNETSEACIVREIREELGVSIKTITEMQSVKWDYGFKAIELIPFLCKIQFGDIKLNEHVQFKWVDTNLLRGVDFSEADKVLINNPLNQQILKKYLGENMNDT